jgi:hypothetical protein
MVTSEPYPPALADGRGKNASYFSWHRRKR